MNASRKRAHMGASPPVFVHLKNFPTVSANFDQQFCQIANGDYIIIARSVVAATFDAAISWGAATQWKNLKGMMLEADKGAARSFEVQEGVYQIRWHIVNHAPESVARIFRGIPPFAIEWLGSGQDFFGWLRLQDSQDSQGWQGLSVFAFLALREVSREVPRREG